MRYFDWNIAIGNYFFNYEKAGKDVHFFISASEIGELGINQLGFTSTEEAITDYYNALCSGYAGFAKTVPIVRRIDIYFLCGTKGRRGYSSGIERTYK